MNPGEIVWFDDERCRVLVPLHQLPGVVFVLLRLVDYRRIILYVGGELVEGDR
jgi:hypothetical protein